MAGITEHKKCICVGFKKTNNNKFWEYTLYDDGTAMTAYGRVGVTRKENIVTHSKALTKWREKTRETNKPDKRYSEVKSVDTGGSSAVSSSSIKNAELKDVAKKQIKHNNPLVQQLIDYLVKVNVHNILKQSGGKIQFDSSSATFQTPLGVIDPIQVAEARILLVDIAEFVRNKDFNNDSFHNTLEDYLRLIPHAVGMSKISPRRIFPNSSKVIAENDLLDGLESSFTDITTAKPTKKKTKKSAPKLFDVDLSIVTDKKVISYVKNLYQKTRKSMHQSNSLSVKTIYAVNIKSMKKQYDKYGANLSNIMQLWHGTKASNLLSIMKQGLIIPPSSSGNVTGRMYGDGVYASSVSTKALNYATNFWGSGGNTDRTFMFLVDMAMGRYYEAKDWGYHYPVDGYDSTWAKSGRALRNDEMIVYRLDQCNLVYLVEFVPRDR